MERTHMAILSALGIVMFLIAYAYNLSISEQTIGQFLQVTAVLFGFYITSAAIILASKSIGEYHKTADRNKNQLLSHTLRDYYKFGLFSLLTNIFIFAIILLFFPVTISKLAEISKLADISFSFSWSRLFFSIAFSLFIINLAFAYLKIKLFLNFFINEAHFKSSQ